MSTQPSSVTDTLSPNEEGEPNFPPARASLLSGKWVMLFEPWLFTGTAIVPVPSLACLVFSGDGRCSGDAVFSSPTGSSRSQLDGHYELRKNTRLEVIDGHLNLNVVQFHARRVFYMIRRDPEEFDLVLLEAANKNAAGKETVQPLAIVGRLQKVRTPAWDWLF